jgi:hypothetical protein
MQGHGYPCPLPVVEVVDTEQEARFVVNQKID